MLNNIDYKEIVISVLDELSKNPNSNTMYYFNNNGGYNYVNKTQSNRRVTDMIIRKLMGGKNTFRFLIDYINNLNDGDDINFKSDEISNYIYMEYSKTINSYLLNLQRCGYIKKGDKKGTYKKITNITDKIKSIQLFDETQRRTMLRLNKLRNICLDA